MAETAGASPGLFASLRGLFDTFLAIVQNRVQLFALEARAEKDRAVSILIGSVILLMTAFMSMLVITAFFLAAFWEQRVWVLLAFSALYLTAMTVAALIVQRKLKAPLFGETLAQLKKDRQCLIHGKSGRASI